MTQPPFTGTEEDFGVDPFQFDAGAVPPNALEDTLAHLMTSLNTLAECVANVDPAASEERMQTPAGLPGYTISQIVQQLQALQSHSQDMRETMIPLSAVNLIDQGKNPNVHIRNFFERTATDNQFTNGVLSALADYRADLHAGLAAALPAAFSDLAAPSEAVDAPPAPAPRPLTIKLEPRS